MVCFDWLDAWRSATARFLLRVVEQEDFRSLGERTWHRKLFLALISTAFAVPLMTFSLNKIEDEKSIRITPHEIYQVSGSWTWRYFKWGVVYGGRHTRLQYFLNDRGLSLGTAKVLDVSNPTPFMITIGLLSASGIVAAGGQKKLPRQPESPGS